MAEQIQIYQNQAVNFTDTSSGGQPPLSRSWAFTGGSISSATGATATVFYTNPGLYNVTLTVTDSFNTSKSLSKTNLVNVSPAFISANFTGTPTSSLLMSTSVNFVDASTGQPEGPNTWSWSLEGSTASTQNFAFSGFNDWFAIGGIPGDQPGDTISVTVQLTASKGALSDTEAKSFPVTKIGPSETNWINSRGYTGPWAIDSVFSFEMNGSVPLNTSDILYPGTDIIYNLDLSGGTQTIDKFHTTTEDCTLTYSGGILPNDSGFCQSSGYLIIDDILYTSGFTQIQDGQYITPGLVSNLYFTSQQLDSAYNGSYYTGYSYTQELIEDCVNSRYPQTNSGQAPSLNKFFPNNEVFNSDEYPVVPSQTYYFQNSGVTGTYQIVIDVEYFSGATASATVDFDANSGLGNEPGAPQGYYYVMQDVGPNPGVATQINNAIASSSIAGGTAEIEAYADPIYNTRTGGSTGDYNGLSLQFKNTNIERVVISDNSDALNPLAITFPFALSNSNPAPATCSGIIGIMDFNSYTLGFGTRLNYGGSIY